MQSTNEKYRAYCDILKRELLVALGCTEPASIAFAAAAAKEALGAFPTRVQVEACGNIIKNTKSVVVPNTDGLKGINTAAAAGILFGDASKKLQVLENIMPAQTAEIKVFAQSGKIKVVPSASEKKFFIKVTVWDGERFASATIEDSHTNLVEVALNGKSVFCGNLQCEESELTAQYALLDVRDIVDFADSVDCADIEEVLERQIRLNSAISQEGLTNDWGARIGKIFAQKGGIYDRAIAAAAAGSDARMSGCDLPVVIVSGSGNQGMTASLPVVEFAKLSGCCHQLLLRALVVSNLMTIYQKIGIGKLSAYCGAVSAGVGAACGIAYLKGGKYDAIAHTASNALAISSGIVCDGAKPSCAGKIATAVFVGLLGLQMYLDGQEFVGGDGIVSDCVDNTIAVVGRLASKGMKETDREIIKIMTEEN